MEVDPGLSDDGGRRRPRVVKVVGLTSGLSLSLGLALIAAVLSWRPVAFFSQLPHQFPDAVGSDGHSRDGLGASPLSPPRSRFQSNHDKFLCNNE